MSENKNYGSKRLVVGAHYGFRDWLSQRVTAALMAVFTLVLVAQVLFGGKLGYLRWAQIFASVSAWTKVVSRRHATSCSGAYSPVQPGVMRPSGDTHVISIVTSPAPPLARSA